VRQLLERFQRLFVSERGQLAFAIILLILIPVALVLNTFIATRAAQENMDFELQRKAVMAEEIFRTAARDRLTDPAALQDLVTRVAAASDDVWGLDILQWQNDEFTVVASAVAGSTGRTVRDLNAIIAWHEDEPVAYATVSSDRRTVGSELQRGDGHDRFWVVVSPLAAADGSRYGLISMKFSSQVVDDIVRNSVTRATVILILTILIVVLLLTANTRLFQFALLFRKLKEVDQMKDEFISIASHELRTPITAIRGYLEMVMGGDFGTIPDSATKALGTVKSSTERLNGLVEDLLNVSRIEQNRLDLELTNIDPKAVIDEVITELRPMANEKKLGYAYDGPLKLPMIKVNRDRFKQVMINLAGNGLKYTKSGSVKLTAEIREKSVRLIVADTGVGMSPAGMQRLFTKFYRVQTDQTRDIPGTGLGLWITKQIVEKMKGSIEVESIEGTGSQFIVTFPITTSTV